MIFVNLFLFLSTHFSDIRFLSTYFYFVNPFFGHSIFVNLIFGYLNFVNPFISIWFLSTYFVPGTFVKNFLLHTSLPIHYKGHPKSFVPLHSHPWQPHTLRDIPSTNCQKVHKPHKFTLPQIVIENSSINIVNSPFINSKLELTPPPQTPVHPHWRVSPNNNPTHQSSKCQYMSLWTLSFLSQGYPHIYLQNHTLAKRILSKNTTHFSPIPQSNFR